MPEKSKRKNTPNSFYGIEWFGDENKPFNPPRAYQRSTVLATVF